MNMVGYTRMTSFARGLFKTRPAGARGSENTNPIPDTLKNRGYYVSHYPRSRALFDKLTPYAAEAQRDFKPGSKDH